MGNRGNLLAVICISLQLSLGVGVFGQESKGSNQPNGCGTAAKQYVVFNDSPKTFFQAWRYCASIGLQLATITSIEDSRLIEQAVNKTKIAGTPTWWIGGTDLGQEGSFIWISTNLPVGYRTGFSNFSPGQPDNYKSNENCLEMGRYGLSQWNDMPCEEQLRFICEDSAVGDK